MVLNTRHKNNMYINSYFWRARVYWPLLCLCRPFGISERCLDSNPESYCGKQAHYQLSLFCPSLFFFAIFAFELWSYHNRCHSSFSWKKPVLFYFSVLSFHGVQYSVQCALCIVRVLLGLPFCTMYIYKLYLIIVSALFSFVIIHNAAYIPTNVLLNPQFVLLVFLH